MQEEKTTGDKPQSEMRKPEEGGNGSPDIGGTFPHSGQKSPSREIRFIDLFGGVGGFRLGLERANLTTSKDGLCQGDKEGLRGGESEDGDVGIKEVRGKERQCNEYPIRSPKRQSFKCVFYSDINKYAVQTYNKNFKENHEPNDITKVKSEDIPDHDLLCGGFPCQSFSIAGKRGGFEDTRGTMFFEIARILRDKRPQMVLLENVKGLLSHDQGRTFGTILNTLAELGYVGQYEVLNSKNFGVPQNRERVFIFGFRGTSAPKVFPLGQKCEKTDEQPVSHTLPSSYHKITRGTTMIDDTKYQQYDPNDLGHRSKTNRVYNPNYSAPTVDGVCGDMKIQVHNFAPRSGDPNKGGTGHLTKENEAYCVDTGCTQGVESKQKIRRLTPAECERLQGFPDGWTRGVSDTQRYKQMGNAVTVNVIKAIGERILDRLHHT